MLPKPLIWQGYPGWWLCACIPHNGNSTSGSGSTPLEAYNKWKEQQLVT